MKKAIAIGSALAVLVVPATAVAKPDRSDRREAAKECRAERGATPATREAFRDKYGTNRNKRNAFGRCVRAGAREEAREERVAHRNAARDCRAEREELGVEAFREQYGKGPRGRNAFGKCVSMKAREAEAEADAEDAEEIATTKNAAKKCAQERREIGREAFREQYGTNRNKRNAFGKCVSSTVKELEDEEDGENGGEEPPTP